MPSVPSRTPRPNPNGAHGRMLTVKQLTKTSYETIHTLPKGVRQQVMRMLLAETARFAKEHGKGWERYVLDQNIKLSRS